MRRTQNSCCPLDFEKSPINQGHSVPLTSDSCPLESRRQTQTSVQFNLSYAYGAVMENDLGKRMSRRTEMSFDTATGRWCAKLGRKEPKSGNTTATSFCCFTEELKIRTAKTPNPTTLGSPHPAKRGRANTWSDEDLAVARVLAEGKSEVSFSVEQLAPLDNRRFRFRPQSTSYTEEPDRERCRKPQWRTCKTE